MLDRSVSIDINTFNDVKQFENNFVKSIAIGPNENQVGTIIFGETADTVFQLNTYNNTKDVLDAIAAMKKHYGYTDVKSGLCKLVEGFKEENGARPLSHGVYRIAILLTDGISTKNYSYCNWSTLQKAAEEVHKRGILVYVIGVGDFDHSELEIIASQVPGALTYLHNFKELPWGNEKLFDEVCIRGISIKIELVVSSIDIKQTHLLNYTLWSDITISILPLLYC